MTSEPDRAEVLEEFALEAEKDPQALERYLERYPALSVDLVDIARELLRPVPANPKPLSRAEEALVDTLWQRYSTVLAIGISPEASGASVKPVLRGRPIQDLRDISRRLGLPRQVITALREGRVIFATLPEHFLNLLASAADSTIAAARAELDVSAPLATASSFKADKTLSEVKRVSFEQLLREAGVDGDIRNRLLGTD